MMSSLTPLANYLIKRGLITDVDKYNTRFNFAKLLTDHPNINVNNNIVSILNTGGDITIRHGGSGRIPSEKSAFASASLMKDGKAVTTLPLCRSSLSRRARAST